MSKEINEAMPKAGEWEEICGEHCVNHIARWYRHKTEPLEMMAFTRVGVHGPGKTKFTIKKIKSPHRASG